MGEIQGTEETKKPYQTVPARRLWARYKVPKRQKTLPECASMQSVGEIQDWNTEDKKPYQTVPARRLWARYKVPKRQKNLTRLCQHADYGRDTRYRRYKKPYQTVPARRLWARYKVPKRQKTLPDCASTQTGPRYKTEILKTKNLTRLCQHADCGRDTRLKYWRQKTLQDCASTQTMGEIQDWNTENKKPYKTVPACRLWARYKAEILKTKTLTRLCQHADYGRDTRLKYWRQKTLPDCASMQTMGEIQGWNTEDKKPYQTVPACRLWARYKAEILKTKTLTRLCQHADYGEIQGWNTEDKKPYQTVPACRLWARYKAEILKTKTLTRLCQHADYGRDTRLKYWRQKTLPDCASLQTMCEIQGWNTEDKKPYQTVPACRLCARYKAEILKTKNLTRLCQPADCGRDTGLVRCPSS